MSSISSASKYVSKKTGMHLAHARKTFSRTSLYFSTLQKPTKNTDLSPDCMQKIAFFTYSAVYASVQLRLACY